MCLSYSPLSNKPNATLQHNFERNLNICACDEATFPAFIHANFALREYDLIVHLSRICHTIHIGHVLANMPVILANMDTIHFVARFNRT